jgi:hypothetical protein
MGRRTARREPRFGGRLRRVGARGTVKTLSHSGQALRLPAWRGEMCICVRQPGQRKSIIGRSLGLALPVAPVVTAAMV